MLLCYEKLQDLENGGNDNETSTIAPPTLPRRSNDKAFLARIWGNFDKQ